MHARKLFASPVALLAAIEVLASVGFILTVLAFVAGSSPTSLQHSAILIFDTSSVRSAFSNATSASPIQDWYEAHYLSICSGMWDAHAASAGKNHSTIRCAPQAAGYTFSLVQILANAGAHPLLVDPSFGTLDTRAPQILLVVGISFTGWCLCSYLYGLVAVLAADAKIPLGVLRAGFLACDVAAIILTNSSARITAMAKRSVGPASVGGGAEVRAWMGAGFYVCAWLGTALMWGAFGVSIVAAFAIRRALRTRDPTARGAHACGGCALEGGVVAGLSGEDKGGKTAW